MGSGIYPTRATGYFKMNTQELNRIKIYKFMRTQIAHLQRGSLLLKITMISRNTGRIREDAKRMDRMIIHRGILHRVSLGMKHN